MADRGVEEDKPAYAGEVVSECAEADRTAPVMDDEIEFPKLEAAEWAPQDGGLLYETGAFVGHARLAEAEEVRHDHPGLWGEGGELMTPERARGWASVHEHHCRTASRVDIVDPMFVYRDVAVRVAARCHRYIDTGLAVRLSSLDFAGSTRPT